uniref:AraC family transcriptional regulator n=1 Tax=Rhabditophanes sp. KR3021 TaxID=114890 RepID=A0AC35TP01_9BILA
MMKNKTNVSISIDNYSNVFTKSFCYWFSKITILDITNDIENITPTFMRLSRELLTQGEYTLYPDNFALTCKADKFSNIILENTFKDGLAMNYSDVFHGTLQTNKKWYIYTIVEDPLTRFLANYAAHCLDSNCFHCNHDINCFIGIFYEKSLHLVSSPTTIKQNTTLHSFLPLSWKCNLSANATKFNYIYLNSNSSSLKQAVSSIVTIFALKPSKYMVLSTLIDKHNAKLQLSLQHSIIKDIKDEILTNHQTLRKFIAIYYFDYIQVNLSVPLLRSIRGY